MKKGLIVLIVIVVLIAGIIGIFVQYYNKFVSANETVNTQWAQVETSYQRRFDLIPNLVEAVKGLTAQEQTVFGEIAEARTRYAGARESSNVSGEIEAAQQFESALGRLLVIVENYPTLKSDQTFIALITELEGTENRISVERRKYNDEVKNYNIMIKRFPGTFFASIFKFSEKPLFEAQAGAETAPKVQF